MQITKQGCSTQHSFLAIFLQLYYFTISFHMCGYGEDKKLSRSKLHVTSLNSGLQSSLLIAGLLYNVLTQSSGNYFPELWSNHILSFRSNLWKKYKDLTPWIPKNERSTCLQSEFISDSIKLVYKTYFSSSARLCQQEWPLEGEDRCSNIFISIICTGCIPGRESEQMQRYARDPCNHEHVSGDTEICNDQRFFLMTSSPMLVKLLRQY